jgi:predicted PurR-regulated permease PerM
MAVIGGVTYIGLLILGVPIAFVLALLPALPAFFPILGRSSVPCAWSSPAAIASISLCGS